MPTALIHLIGYLFASIGYGLKTGFAATFFYVLCVSISFLLYAESIDWPMIYGTSLYVLGIGSLVCALIFLLSVPFRGILRRRTGRRAGYIVASISALITVGFSILLAGSMSSSINLVIYAASVPAIYLGAKFYGATWKMIEEADPSAHDVREPTLAG